MRNYPHVKFVTLAQRREDSFPCTSLEAWRQQGPPLTLLAQLCLESASYARGVRLFTGDMIGPTPRVFFSGVTVPMPGKSAPSFAI